MAASTEHLRMHFGPLERQVKQLLNNDLKEICRREGLPISGVKAVLQNRVLDQLKILMNTPDAPRFDELRSLIQSHGRGTSSAVNLPSGVSPAAFPAPATPLASHHYNHAQPGAFRAQALGHGVGVHQNHGSRLNFKSSPFWSLQEPLSSVVDLPLMGQSRHVAHAIITLSPTTLERIRGDKNMRIMLFCAVDVAGYLGPVDIAFPGQIELKVNGEAYGGNLRGIKKKPGTTRPADITDLLRKLPSYNNNVSLTYAATDKKYAFIVHLTKKHTVAELVERVKRGHHISKEAVLKEMNAKAKDEDIETTSTVMSLKCPLSFMRLSLPCRSNICTHNQCFDASSFLEVQEQAPQWNCPICNKVFSFSNLVVDQYVQDILGTTSKSVDQVTIEPDGTWKQGAMAEESRNSSTSTKRKAAEAFDFEDLVEITDHKSNGAKKDISATPLSYLTTPSREPSMAASTTGISGAKRQQAQVVDLTLSDDDEPIAPSVKRQSLPANTAFNTYPFGAPLPRPPPNGFSFPLLQHPQSQSPNHPTPPGYPTGAYGPSWR